MPCTFPKIIPANADSKYFKTLVDTYDYSTHLDETEIQKFVSYSKNDHIYDFYNYYYHCTFPVLHKQGKHPIRNQLSTIATQHVGAYAEKDCFDRVCTNCGQAYLVSLDLEPQEYNPRCEIIDGTGRIIRTWREHQTQILPFEKRAKYNHRDETKTLKVAALHGDLIYTTGGLEIVGLYLIDANYNLLLSETVPFKDRIVNPGYPNNNNIKVAKLGNFTCTLKQLQEKIKKYVGAQTLLIGYQLGPVLRALEMNYSCCVDLSLVKYFQPAGVPLKEYLFGLSQDVDDISVLSNDKSNRKSSERKASAYMAIMMSVWRQSMARESNKLVKIQNKEQQNEDVDENVVIVDDIEDDVEIVEFKKKIPDGKLCHKKEKKVKNNQNLIKTDGTEQNFYLSDPNEIVAESKEMETTNFVNVNEKNPNIKSKWNHHELLLENENLNGQAKPFKRLIIHPKGFDNTLYNHLHSQIIRSNDEKLRLKFPMWEEDCDKQPRLLNFANHGGYKMFMDKKKEHITCFRCKKDYKIDDEFNVLEDQEPCTITEEGGDIHQFDTHYTDLLPLSQSKEFESVRKNDAIPSNRVLIVCGDVVYTNQGPFVTRFVMMDVHKNLIMELNVEMPENVKIVYSGETFTTRDDLSNAFVSKNVLREKIFEKMDESTILVGYEISLLLRSLSIVHDNTIEISQLKPFLQPNHLPFHIQQLRQVAEKCFTVDFNSYYHKHLQWKAKLVAGITIFNCYNFNDLEKKKKPSLNAIDIDDVKDQLLNVRGIDKNTLLDWYM
uniref:Exonuclease domain-containing protein n=1 Tax=Rhabditophanes sp. KR3021 TaxID=114890 RepID=A0AC35U8Z0_9BILA